MLIVHNLVEPSGTLFGNEPKQKHQALVDHICVLHFAQAPQKATIPGFVDRVC